MIGYLELMLPIFGKENSEKSKLFLKILVFPAFQEPFREITRNDNHSGPKNFLRVVKLPWPHTNCNHISVVLACTITRNFFFLIQGGSSRTRIWATSLLQTSTLTLHFHFLFFKFYFITIFRRDGSKINAKLIFPGFLFFFFNYLKHAIIRKYLGRDVVNVNDSDIRRRTVLIVTLIDIRNR